jgi:hypothetical protein
MGRTMTIWQDVGTEGGIALRDERMAGLGDGGGGRVRNDVTRFGIEASDCSDLAPCNWPLVRNEPIRVTYQLLIFNQGSISNLRWK